MNVLSFLVGLFLGCFLGVMAMGLLNMAGDGGRPMPRHAPRVVKR